MFEATLRRCPDAVAVHYLDAALTHAELDALSGAFGAALAQRGVARGDRIALYLQNVPEFVIAVLAAWKLGAIAVPVNPMHKEREVRTLLEDCEPVAMVTLESLRDEAASAAVAGTSVAHRRDRPRSCTSSRAPTPDSPRGIPASAPPTSPS